MIENLETISTADLIAGNHFTDMEKFTMWNVDVATLARKNNIKTKCTDLLWGYRPRGKHVKGQDEVASLDELMGNKGTLHVKTPATDDAPAVVTMKAVGIGGDINFRAKRVAQLAAAYASVDMDGDCEEDNAVELPAIQNFYAKNQ